MSRKVGMINRHNVKNHKDHFEVKSVRGTWVIHWLQCQTTWCGIPSQTLYTKSVWPNDSIIEVDQETMHAVGPLPVCECCGETSRPNILMFNDWTWLS